MQSTHLGPSLEFKLFVSGGCVPSRLVSQLHHGSATWNVLPMELDVMELDLSVPSKLISVLLRDLSQHSSLGSCVSFSPVCKP